MTCSDHRDPDCADCQVTGRSLTACRYHNWEAAVDLKIKTHPLIQGEFGLEDLPDTDTRALFDSEVLPGDAALAILTEVGFFDQWTSID